MFSFSFLKEDFSKNNLLDFPCFLDKLRFLVFIKWSFQCSTPQNQQSFATVAFDNLPGLLWQGFGIYKMMIQSTILQNSSINAVPDHFLNGHCRNVFFQVWFLFFQYFWRFFVFLFMFVCIPSVFSSKTFFPRAIFWISLLLTAKIQGSCVYKMQFSI